MKRIAWLASVAALAATGACAVTESVETKTYSLSGFDSISASTGVNVVLKQGPFSIRAEGTQSEIDRLRIETNGSTLSIRQEGSDWNWFSWSYHRDLVTVVAPSFVRVEASGGADVEMHGLKAGVLSLSASGGGDIDGDGVSIDTLDVSTSGGGDINLDGTCGTLTASASGGGDFSSRRLTCTDATASASGGGDIDITVTGIARGKASAGGDVTFHGNPTTVEKDESSGGDVNVDS